MKDARERRLWMFLCPVTGKRNDLPDVGGNLTLTSTGTERIFRAIVPDSNVEKVPIGTLCCSCCRTPQVLQTMQPVVPQKASV